VRACSSLHSSSLQHPRLHCVRATSCTPHHIRAPAPAPPRDSSFLWRFYQARVLSVLRHSLYSLCSIRAAFSIRARFRTGWVEEEDKGILAGWWLRHWLGDCEVCRGSGHLAQCLRCSCLARHSSIASIKAKTSLCLSVFESEEALRPSY
jgi:hypothetical protein